MKVPIIPIQTLFQENLVWIIQHMIKYHVQHLHVLEKLTLDITRTQKPNVRYSNVGCCECDHYGHFLIVCSNIKIGRVIKIFRFQVFHICQNGGHKDSFLCPNGSIFNQKYSVCDWWYSFDCDTTQEEFPVNFEIQRVTPTPEYQDPQQYPIVDHYQTNQVLLYTHPQQNEYTDLNIASSGGNNNPNEANKSTQRKKSNNIRETSGTDRTINPNSQRSGGESEKTTTRNHVSVRKVGKHRSDNNVRPLFQSGNHLDLTINEEKLNKSGVVNTTLVHPNVYPSGSNGFSNGRINLLKPVALLIPSQSDAYYQQTGDVRNINERESNNYP